MASGRLIRFEPEFANISLRISIVDFESLGQILRLSIGLNFIPKKSRSGFEGSNGFGCGAGVVPGPELIWGLNEDPDDVFL